MEAKLIKIDRNGSKHYEGMVVCDRCGGNGGSDTWKFTGWTCYKCGGTGKIASKWIERTPEYQAKLDARRAKKQAERMAELERERAEREALIAEEEAKRKAEEERIKAQKAISQYVGEVGDKVDVKAVYDHSAWFDVKLGWTKQRVFIHTFRDENGSAIVWKTSSNSLYNIAEGDTVQIKGTVKEHSEYKDEKQTVLTRCKVTA